MGSPTLMGRVCHIILCLKDDRHSAAVTDTVSGASVPLTLASLSMKWSQLHLMITRSTTPDIMKMAVKLTEFFNAQMANSKSLLASIQYDFRDGTARKPLLKVSPPKTSSTESSQDKARVIKRHIGMNGGELILQGHNLTLVIFHGLNFKSRQWALFSLNEPQINFVTDRGDKGDSKWTNNFDSLFSRASFLSLHLVNQKLFFYLGGEDQTAPANTRSRTNMASISKVTRNSNEPPSHVNISEWFNYTSSAILAVGM